MRIAAVSVLGLLLATGSAWAQSSYDYRDRDRDGMRGSDSYTYNSDRSARRGGGYGDDEAGYGENRRSRGAVFHLKAGDREFRVRCASDESTRECVDAALMMFRQVQDASRTSTTLSPSSPGSSTTSTTPGATGGTGSATGR